VYLKFFEVPGKQGLYSSKPNYQGAADGRRLPSPGRVPWRSAWNKTAAQVQSINGDNRRSSAVWFNVDRNVMYIETICQQDFEFVCNFMSG
jgi:hypothetical protein